MNGLSFNKLSLLKRENYKKMYNSSLREEYRDALRKICDALNNPYDLEQASFSYFMKTRNQNSIIFRQNVVEGELEKLQENFFLLENFVKISECSLFYEDEKNQETLKKHIFDRVGDLSIELLGQGSNPLEEELSKFQQQRKKELKTKTDELYKKLTDLFSNNKIDEKKVEKKETKQQLKSSSPIELLCKKTDELFKSGGNKLNNQQLNQKKNSQADTAALCKQLDSLLHMNGDKTSNQTFNNKNESKDFNATGDSLNYNSDFPSISQGNSFTKR